MFIDFWKKTLIEIRQCSLFFFLFTWSGVHSLIINGVILADAGYYKVIVRNSGGEIESEAELYVEPTGGRPLGGTELYNT